MLVDSHCHLNFPDFKDDLDAVIERARGAGVTTMQTICTELAEFDEVLAIANRYDGVFCSVGVHPNESAKAPLAETGEIIARTKHAKGHRHRRDRAGLPFSSVVPWLDHGTS